MIMKRVFLLSLVFGSLFLVHATAQADETVTVTATNSDISENLDLKTVATLFGQAKNLEEFEQMLNNPDSAFSNLDLNGDGDVDYLRVIETADQERHLVVIQAVLAKDIYQDVASIFVEKDPESEAVTVQVIGDEYIYGANYIIEPVYLYRPVIYDWFWGPSWVAWHSPYYWDYWPIWWHPYHCIAHHLYWDHCYWHHHHHPICSFRTGHHYRPHYQSMRPSVSRTDYATRHPERSFATRNASRNVTNARSFDRNRQAAVRGANTMRNPSAGAAPDTRVSSRSTSNRTFGSTNVRTNNRIETSASNRNSASRVGASSTDRSNTATRSQTVTTRSTGNTSSRNSSVSSATRRSNDAATPVRSTSTVNRSSSVSTSSRSVSAPSVNRSSNTSSTRAGSSSSSSSSMRTSSSSSVRSSGGSSIMRSGGMSSSSGSMRPSGGGSSRGGGGTTRR